VRIANTTIAANSASSWKETGAGGSGGALYVDKTSNATLVDNAARIAAGIAASNTVTLQASLLTGNRGALESGECGGSGRIVSRGWNLLSRQVDVDTSRSTAICWARCRTSSIRDVWSRLEYGSVERDQPGDRSRASRPMSDHRSTNGSARERPGTAVIRAPSNARLTMRRPDSWDMLR
jgi:hypothetical protein